MKIFSFIAVLFLAACVSDGYKTPSLSNAESMSEQTLCYRAAYAKADPAVNAEISRRNIDCDDTAFDLEVGGEGSF